MARIGRPTGSRTTPESIVQAVEILSDLGVRAADIHRTLKELIGSRTPPERTVRDIVQRAGRPGEDESGTWSALEAREGVSGRHILAVLRGVAIASDGRIRRITRHEAECVAALADLAPHLDALSLWRLARIYQRRAQSKLGTDDLDLYLAFQPWRGGPAAERYTSLLESQSEVQPWPPVYLPGVPTAANSSYEMPALQRWVTRLEQQLEEARIAHDEVYGEAESNG